MKRKKKLNIIIVGLVILLFSCAEDDSFTQSPSALLSVVRDTITLDTAFSNVPTPMRTFWVYNHSGKNLRCKSVVLSGGNQTGFRVNVDGAYLSDKQGYQVSGIEIRNNDSARVAVELTSAYNREKEAQLVEDKLVFVLESGVRLPIVLRGYSWDAQLMRGLRIQRDTTLSGDKPLVFYAPIIVEQGAQLTLAAGTTLYFHDNAGIDVLGSLLSQGRQGREVILRGDRLDHMFNYLPYDRTAGRWQGIHFRASSYGNELTYTDIHSAYNGIVCDSSNVSSLKLNLSNCTVHNCQGYGIKSTDTWIQLNNCQLSNTLHDCLYVLGGRLEANQCTLAQFYPFSTQRGAAFHLSNSVNGVSHPLLLSKVQNSLITGYADDVFKGQRVDSVAFNYEFVDDVMRTPQLTTEDSVHFVRVIFENTKDTANYGQKHFMNIDANLLKYDFRLAKQSTAISKANVSTALPTDRNGNSRDNHPDIGAFEWKQE